MTIKDYIYPKKKKRSYFHNLRGFELNYTEKVQVFSIRWISLLIFIKQLYAGHFNTLTSNTKRLMGKAVHQAHDMGKISWK